MTTKWKPTTGELSKALNGSVALNFSESGGPQCSDSCPFKGSVCYAERLETVRTNCDVGGRRRRLAGFESVATAYVEQLERTGSAPWVRFSAFGSLPHSLSDAGRTFFGRIVRTAVQVAGAGRVHVPVESVRKYRLYSAIAGAAGVVVRLSAHTYERAMAHTRKGIAISIVERKVAGEKTAARLDRAKETAARFRKAGRTAMVCPAIAADIRGTEPVKCGKCKACGSDRVDVVVYPEH
jgi:hypothetical protein